MHIFDEIGIRRATLGPWLDARRSPQKRKIMGFGHRVYKNGDSRVPTMKAALDTLVEHYGRPDCSRRSTTPSSRRWSRAQGHLAEPRLPVRARRTT